MPVVISNDFEVTLKDLEKRKLDGFMVEATPHIGNLGVSTLAAASLGLTIKLVDSTKGEKDNLFFPHCVISNGQKEQIACEKVLTTHNVISDSNQSVSEFHTTEIGKRFGTIFPQSDWMETNTDTILPVLEVANKFTDGLIWERYVSEQGMVGLNHHHHSSKLPEKIHRVTVSRDSEGWITANPVNLLCDMIGGIRHSDRTKVFMISGPSMYKYIYQKFRHFGHMDQFISQLYDAVRRTGLFDLPELLEVSMVPLSCLSYFTAPSTLKDELNRKLGYLERLIKGNKRAGEKERQKKLSGKSISRMALRRAKVFQELNKPLEKVCADPTTGIFYTQHDLLEEKETMYIPDEIMETPLQVLWNKAERMERLMRYRVS